jgi:hypothetical protein
LRGDSLLHELRWDRLIIDEGYHVRNQTTGMYQSTCALDAETGQFCSTLRNETQKRLSHGRPVLMRMKVVAERPDIFRPSPSQNAEHMERLTESGIKSFLLNIQYRMHPDIGDFISTTFYDSKLRTDQSCSNRVGGQVFRDWIVSLKKGIVPANSMFISVENSPTWKGSTRVSHCWDILHEGRCGDGSQACHSGSQHEGCPRVGFATQLQILVLQEIVSYSNRLLQPAINPLNTHRPFPQLGNEKTTFIESRFLRTSRC